jgi:hypothetical protein
MQQITDERIVSYKLINYTEWIDHMKRGDTLTVIGRDMIVGIGSIGGDVLIDVQGEGSRVTFDPTYRDLVHFAPCFTEDQYSPLPVV